MVTLPSGKTLQPGYIATFAGTGKPDGDLGDGQRADLASLSSPTALALRRSDGALFIADTGHRRVRKIDASGSITTVVGTGKPGSDGDGPNATKARLYEPRGLALGPDESLFIADTVAHGVRRVTSDGAISTIVGTLGDGNSGDGGPAGKARLREPTGLAADAAGNLYIADSGNHVVRRIGPDGNITRYAGNPDSTKPVTDGAQALDVSFKGVKLTALTLDDGGNLYITGNQGNNNAGRTWRVDLRGIITEVRGLGFRRTVCIGGDGAYYAGLNEGLYVLPPGWQKTVPVVGSRSTAGTDADPGPAPTARIWLSFFSGLVVTSGGDLYMADTKNHRVRVLGQARAAATAVVRVSDAAAVPDVVPVGESRQVDFTWKVTHTGLRTPERETVVLALPAGATVKSFDPKAAGNLLVSATTDTVTWQYSHDCPKEASYRVSALLPAVPTAGSTLAAQVTVDNDTPGPDWQPGRASRAITVTALGDGALSVSGTDAQPPAVPADGTTHQAVFSWNVERAGSGSLNGVKVSALLSAGVQASACTPQPDDLAANPLTWSLTGTGVSQHFALTAGVALAADAGEARVQVTAASPSGQSAWAPVVLEADQPGALTVTDRQALPASVAAGATTKNVHLSWSVRRAGTVPLDGVKVSALLPAGVRASACTPAPDSLTANPLTWSLTGTDTSRDFDLTADLTPGTDADEARVRVTATPRRGDSAAGDVVVKAVASGGVALTQAGVSPAAVEGGKADQRVLFSWDVDAAAGAASVQGVKVSAQLPLGVKAVACTPAPDSLTARPLTWTLGTTGVSQRFALVADVTLAAGSSATLQLTAATPSGKTANGSVTVSASPVSTPVAGAVDVTRAAVSPTSVKAGSTTVGAQFSWDVQRAGGGSLQGVTVSAQLPVQAKRVSFTPPGATVDGQSVTWKLTGTDTVQRFTLTADVTPGDHDESCAVQVNARSADGATSDATDIALDVLPKEAPPAGAVTVSGTGTLPPSVEAGSTTTGVLFSWDVQRAGGGSLRNVTVSAQLPVQAKRVSFTPPGATVDGQSVTWKLTGTDAVQRFTLTADVTPGDNDTSCAVRVEVRPPGGGTVGKDITLPVTAKEKPPAGAVTISGEGATPSPVPGGETTAGVVFSWQVQRAGGGSLNDVTVSALLPAQAKRVSFTPPGATVDGQSLVWKLTGTDAVQRFTLTADVTPGDHDESCAVRVEARPPAGGGTVGKDVTLPVTPKGPARLAVLAIPSWKVFPAQAGKGGHVAFAWKITNRGQGTAQGVKATVTLPVGLTPAGEYLDTAGVWDKDKRTLTSNQAGTLKPGAYWWITVVARVDQDAPGGDLEVPAVVSATGLAATPATTARVTVKDKALVWTVAPDDIKAAFLSLGALTHPDDPKLGLVGGIGGGPVGGIVPGIGITSLVTSLLSVFGIVSGLFVSIFSFLGILSFWGGFGGFGSGPDGPDGPDGPEPDQPENEDPDDDEKKNKITHLWFTRTTLSPARPAPGQSVTLTWELSNRGGEDATSVAVQLRLPDTLELTDVTGDGTWSRDAAFAYGSLGTLTKGAKATITASAKVRDGAADTKSATAWATGGHATPAFASTQVPVQASSALLLSPGQTHPQPARPGQDVTFTWPLRAAPGHTAENTKVTLTLPASGLDNPRITVDGEDVPATAPTHTFDHELTDADAPVQIVLTGKIPDGHTQDLTAAVTATADGLKTPVTDTAKAVIKAKGTGLRATGTLLPSPVTAGLGATYAWALTNDGTTDVTGLSLTAQLPATAVANVRPARGGKATGPGTVTWDKSAINSGGTLKTGATWIASVDVDITPDATGTLPAATATATGDNNAKDTTNPVSAAITTLTRLALAASASPLKVKAGETVTFIFSITATGPSTHGGATLTIKPTAGLTPTQVTVNGARQDTALTGATITVPLPATPRNPDTAVTVALTATAAAGPQSATATLTTGTQQDTVPTAKAGVQAGADTAPTSLTPRPAGVRHITAGASSDLTWTAVNGTQTTDTDATFTLTTPRQLTVQQVTVNGHPADLKRNGTTVTAALGKLPAHTDVPLTATVHAAADATGSGDVAAVLTVPPGDSAKATTVVRFTSSTILKAQAQHWPDPPTPGQEVFWQWTVANDGTSTSPERSLTATASTDLTVKEAGPNATTDGRTITWRSLPALPPGSAWTLTALATLAAGATTAEPAITLDL
ncbi:hypothetical protein [Kitasatospora sp. NPDC001527]|uniref:hypothetical protein n=1 Tax=Kitasatospora sp. NPDC001527 TaxID=3154519 RepID=UPI003317CBC0